MIGGRVYRVRRRRALFDVMVDGRKVTRSTSPDVARAMERASRRRGRTVWVRKWRPAGWSVIHPSGTVVAVFRGNRGLVPAVGLAVRGSLANLGVLP